MNIFDRYRRKLDRNRHRNQMRKIAAYNKKLLVKSGEKNNSPQSINYVAVCKRRINGNTI